MFILEYSEAESLMGSSFFFKISFVYKVCVRERGEGGACVGVCSEVSLRSWLPYKGIPQIISFRYARQTL